MSRILYTAIIVTIFINLFGCESEDSEYMLVTLNGKTKHFVPQKAHMTIADGDSMIFHYGAGGKIEHDNSYETVGVFPPFPPSLPLGIIGYAIVTDGLSDRYIGYDNIVFEYNTDSTYATGSFSSTLSGDTYNALEIKGRFRVNMTK